MQDFSQDNQCPDWSLNQTSPEYKLTCLVCLTLKYHLLKQYLTVHIHDMLDLTKLVQKYVDAYT